MNRDDIIRMAREAGMDMSKSDMGWTTADALNVLYPECVYTENLQRFAALVATAEREACAKVAEKMLRFYTQAVTGVPEAIRARGEKA